MAPFVRAYCSLGSSSTMEIHLIIIFKLTSEKIFYMLYSMSIIVMTESLTLMLCYENIV